MKKIISILAFQLLVVLCFSQVTVKNLLTENLSNPIGIGATQPRFSWLLISNKRNVIQTAYEIKVSLDKETVWSSGKITSAQSVQINYEGKALQSEKKIYMACKSMG